MNEMVLPVEALDLCKKKAKFGPVQSQENAKSNNCDECVKIKNVACRDALFR